MCLFDSKIFVHITRSVNSNPSNEFDTKTSEMIVSAADSGSGSRAVHYSNV